MSDNIVIKYSDFFQDDGGFKRTKEQFYKLGDDLIVKAKEVREKTRLISLNETEQINKLMTDTQALIEMRKKYAQSLQNIKRLEKQLETARKRKPKIFNAETEAIKKRNREMRMIAKIQNTQKNSIENLRAKLSLVTIAWSKLTEAEIKNTKRGKRLNESKKQLTSTLLALERATKDNRRNVGNYNGAINKLRGSFVNLTSAMGISLGLFGAFRLLRSSISIVRDFEKRNATLAGVLRVEKSEISDLKTQARELGETTVRTATEVTELQIAYARLGFAQSDIINMTKATIDASIAMNSNLDETANLVGAIIKSYDNLSSVDSEHIAEVLVGGVTRSALTFEKLKISLPKVLGAANTLNIGLEEVVATLGKLSDAGVEASIAGTSLRKVYSSAAKRGTDYKKAIDALTHSQNKYADAVKYFGERAAVQALIIANNVTGLNELQQALNNANDMQKLVNNELNTLDGSLKLVKSAWESMILSLNDTTSAGNGLTVMLRFLAQNMKTIFKVAGILTSAWIAYNVVQKASNLLMFTKTNLSRLLTFATIRQTAATEAATVAQESYNLATKATPWGFAIAMLTALRVAYISFKDNVSRAEKAQKRFNDAIKEGHKIAREQINEMGKYTSAGITQLQIQRDKKIADDEKNRQKYELGYLEKKKAYLKYEAEQTKQKIIDLQNQQKSYEKLYTYRSGFDKSGNPIYKKDTIGLGNDKGYGQTTGQLQEYLRKLVEINNEIEKSEINKTNTIKKQTKSQKSAYEKYLKYMESLRRRLQDLRDEKIKDDEQREITQSNRKYDREIKAIKKYSKHLSKVEIELIAELEERKEREKIKIQKKYSDKKLKNLERIKTIERELMQNDVQKQIENERAKTKKLIEEIKSNNAVSLEIKKQLIKSANEKLIRYEKEIKLKSKLTDLQNQMLIEKAKIEQKRTLFTSGSKFEEWKQNEFLKIEKAYLEKRLKMLVDANDKRYKVEIEQIKGRLANITSDLSMNTPEIKKWKTFGEQIKQVMTLMTSEIEKLLQKSISDSEKAIDKQQKLVETQRQRAQQGLSNTYAFEQKEMAKREAEVIKRQKRLERIQKLMSYWNTYNANVQALKENEDTSVAIQRTLRDIGIIEALTASLTSFGEGGIVADKLPSNGIFRGRSHKGKYGGIPILVEGNEGILSTREMNNLGRDNFYRIKEMASMGVVDKNMFGKQKRQIPAISGVPIVQTDIMEKELREIKTTLKGQKQQTFDAFEIVDNVLKFTETVIEKNKIKRNHYKIEKPRL